MRREAPNAPPSVLDYIREQRIWIGREAVDLMKLREKSEKK
ncbi:hypothetical protein A2U01_0072826, partial [Trifolium medium]|nr:hypothetical protein [Trifolium medium]